MNDNCVYKGSANRGCVVGRGQLFATTTATDTAISDQEEIVICNNVVLDLQGQYNSETGIFDLNKLDVSRKSKLYIDMSASITVDPSYPWAQGDRVKIDVFNMQDSALLDSFYLSPEWVRANDERTAPFYHIDSYKTNNNFRGSSFLEMNGWDGFFLSISLTNVAEPPGLVTVKRLASFTLTVLDLSEEAS